MKQKLRSSSIFFNCSLSLKATSILLSGTYWMSLSGPQLTAVICGRYPVWLIHWDMVSSKGSHVSFWLKGSKFPRVTLSAEGFCPSVVILCAKFHFMVFISCNFVCFSFTLWPPVIFDKLTYQYLTEEKPGQKNDVCPWGK